MTKITPKRVGAIAGSQLELYLATGRDRPYTVIAGSLTNPQRNLTQYPARNQA